MASRPLSVSTVHTVYCKQSAYIDIDLWAYIEKQPVVYIFIILSLLNSPDDSALFRGYSVKIKPDSTVYAAAWSYNWWMPPMDE